MCYQIIAFDAVNVGYTEPSWRWFLLFFGFTLGWSIVCRCLDASLKQVVPLKHFLISIIIRLIDTTKAIADQRAVTQRMFVLRLGLRNKGLFLHSTDIF